jgi:uncharacterized protein
MSPEEMMRFRNWAVIGVRQDAEQYAYRIYRILKENGYNAYPVNPRSESIDGNRCYASVLDIPYEIDAADMVVNPVTGAGLLDGMKEKNIKYLWLQPGTYNDSFIAKAEAMGFIYVRDCILARLIQGNKGES